MFDKPNVLSTLLDPRFKGRYMQHESFAQGKMMPLEEVKRVAEEQIEQESEGDGRVSLENEPPAKKKKGDSLQEDIHIDFSSCYDELFDEQEDSPVIEEGEARAQRNVPFSVLAAELEGYMNMPNIERNENPFIWWKQHEYSLPRISQLAKQYLSMPQNGSFQKLGTFLKKNALDFCLEMAKCCFLFIKI